MIFTQAKQRASDIVYGVIANFLALWDGRTPWRAKGAAALAIAITFAVHAMIPNFAFRPYTSEIFRFVGIGAAIWIIGKLVPTKLMREFRARATSIEMQARVQSYFECLIVVVILAAFGLLYLSWQRTAG